MTRLRINMKKEHELKTDYLFFAAAWSGDKPFEIRKNDRDFHTGDILILLEYPTPKNYAQRKIKAEISFMLVEFGGLCEGYVAMGLKVLQRTC